MENKVINKNDSNEIAFIRKISVQSEISTSFIASFKLNPFPAIAFEQYSSVARALGL